MLNLKLLLIFTVLLTFSFTTYAQDYVDVIVDKSCECINSFPDSLGKKELTMKMGLCMIDAAQPYQKKLKKDFGIDLNNIDKGEGEKLGRMVGMKLATKCPDALMKVVNKMNPELLEDDVEIEEGTKEGIVTKIESSMFVIFFIKDSEGKTGKYIWTTYIENDIDLPESYNGLQGKEVYIEYEEQEFFDPVIDEYRKFKVITIIEII